jgi:hypothetical protein
MTKGVRCDNLIVDGVQMSTDECRWTARLRDWAHKRYPTSQITVSNRAINACNSICQLSSLAQSLPRDHPVDIVLLDMAVNDAMVNVALALAESQLKVIAESHNDGRRSIPILAAVEVTLRHALSLPSQPAVVVVQSFRNLGAESGGNAEMDLQVLLVASANILYYIITSLR